MLNHLRFIKDASKIKNEAIAGGISGVVILLFYMLTAGFTPGIELSSFPQPVPGVFEAHLGSSEAIGVLDGSWEFLDGRLVTEKSDFSEEDSKALLKVILPGKWNSYRSDQGVNPSFGYGTYFATIKLMRTTSVRSWHLR